jgi:hypothetical protein
VDLPPSGGAASGINDPCGFQPLEMSGYSQSYVFLSQDQEIGGSPLMFESLDGGHQHTFHPSSTSGSIDRPSMQTKNNVTNDIESAYEAMMNSRKMEFQSIQRS